MINRSGPLGIDVGLWQRYGVGKAPSITVVTGMFERSRKYRGPVFEPAS